MKGWSKGGGEEAEVVEVDGESVCGGFRKLVYGDFEICDFHISRIEESRFVIFEDRESRFRDL